MEYLFFPKSFNGLSTHMLILHHTCIFRWLASRKRPSYTVEFDETGNPDDYEFYACLHEKSDGSSEDDSDVPSQEDVSPCALRFHSIYFCVLHLRLWASGDISSNIYFFFSCKGQTIVIQMTAGQHSYTRIVWKRLFSFFSFLFSKPCRISFFSLVVFWQIAHCLFMSDIFCSELESIYSVW